jgi:hypothetical protein
MNTIQTKNGTFTRLNIPFYFGQNGEILKAVYTKYTTGFIKVRAGQYECIKIDMFEN